jgi:hypothetical protein
VPNFLLMELSDAQRDQILAILQGAASPVAPEPTAETAEPAAAPESVEREPDDEEWDRRLAEKYKRKGFDDLGRVLNAQETAGMVIRLQAEGRAVLEWVAENGPEFVGNDPFLDWHGHISRAMHSETGEGGRIFTLPLRRRGMRAMRVANWRALRKHFGIE